VLPPEQRLDAAGWRRMFEMGADNPEAWRASAETLLNAARIVGEKVWTNGVLTDVVISVQAMLVGMSIECSLKALWLKQDRKYARPGAGFLRDDRLDLTVMDGATAHDLRRMATAVGLTDVAELDLLERLSWFVAWAGRYPVPRVAEKMVPRDMETRDNVIPRVISVDDVAEAEAIAVRLFDEATPWT
jgi:hypothetical protein